MDVSRLSGRARYSSRKVSRRVSLKPTRRESQLSASEKKSFERLPRKRGLKQNNFQSRNQGANHGE